jgi:hypothetical protein
VVATCGRPGGLAKATLELSRLGGMIWALLERGCTEHWLVGDKSVAESVGRVVVVVV